MLNEGAASSPPPPPPNPPQARQSFPRPLNPAPPAISSFSRSRLRFIYTGSAIALLCALAVFYFLFRQDRPSAPKARMAASPVAAPAPAQAPAPTASAPVVSTPKEEPTQQEPLPEPVQFRIKRAKTFEKVGPIRLRLIKTNLRWNTCDLYINSGGASFQKQAHLDKPVQIDLRDGAGSAVLVVSGIRSDQISGSVQQK